MFYIGAHMSSAKGFRKMGEAAVGIGANALQFFTRNPRGGAARALDLEDVQAFREILEKHSFAPLLAHAPYTLNPCSADARVRAFARQAMREDLERMAHFPGSFYNFHPGSHVGQGVEQGICLIAELLNEILQAEQSVAVLLETMAGKGSEIGATFEQLAEIIKRVHLPEKVGICLDTCHVYDAGYDLVHDLDGVMDLFDRRIGFNKLKAVHLNDSKNPFASHKDRHERIGWGSIGLAAFERILSHPALSDVPFFLETPNELNGYAAEIILLRALRDGGGKSTAVKQEKSPLIQMFLAVLKDPEVSQEQPGAAAGAIRWLELLPKQEQALIYQYIEEEVLRLVEQDQIAKEDAFPEEAPFLVLLIYVLQGLQSKEAHSILDRILTKGKDGYPHIVSFIQTPSINLKNC